MSFPPILTKKQNYRLWQDGEFGNKLRAWTVEEYEQSDYTGKVAIRMRGGPGGGICFYDIPRDRALDALPFLACGGLLLDDLMVNEMAPSEGVVLQGEYLNDPGLCWAQFVYSRERMPMRDALATSKSISTGLRTNFMLQEAMTPSSYADWQLLLDRYPGHVLEVSIYDRCVGDIPGRNALVWEVRKY